MQMKILRIITLLLVQYHVIGEKVDFNPAEFLPKEETHKQAN